MVANEPPTAVDDDTTVRSPTQIDVVANDTDPNQADIGERLSVAPSAPVTTAAGATVNCPSEWSEQACDYQPAPGYAGTDTFDYTVVDLNGATDVGTVTVTVPPNQPPVATDDTLVTQVRYGATILPVQLSVVGNDTDPDGDPVLPQAVSTTTSAGGVVACSYTCDYTPPTGFYGTDTFTYAAVDGLGAVSAPATVTVTVVPDDPPVATDDAASTKGTRPVQVAVLANDSDDHGGYWLVNTGNVGGSDATSAAGGTVACFDTGCGYTAPAGFAGTDSFHYVISDGVSTSQGTVSVAVGANAAPVANDDSLLFRIEDGFTQDNDYDVKVPVVANDTDADGDPLVADGYGVTATGHEWYCQDQICTVTVPQMYVGVETFTYTVTDGYGGTDTAEVSVDIDVKNFSPDVQPDSASTSVDTPVTVDVLANDQSVYPGYGTIAVDAGTTTSAAGGNVVCSPANCTYTPPPGFTGTDTFVYRAITQYLAGAHGTVTVTVVPGVSGVTPDGGTLASGGTPTAGDPLTTSVTTPVGGPVAIVERATATTPPVGYGLFGQEVALTAPVQTAAAPLQVAFQLDATLLGGTPAGSVQVWRNGALVPNCVGGATATAANPDPCVKQRTALTGGDAQLTVLTSAASVWSFGKMTAVPPAAPTAVGATPAVRSAVVSWTAPNPTGGAPISAYQVTATPVPGSIPPGVSAPARTVTVSGSPAATMATVGSLANGVSYTFTVRARNSVNTGYGPASTPSDPVTVPSVPSVPVVSSAAAGLRSAIATWDAPLDGGSPITSYRLTATPVAGGTARSVTVAAPATSGTVTGLLDSTGYTLSVTATNAVGTGTSSTPSTPVTTPSGVPSSPHDVVATAGIRSAVVTWSSPLSDGGAAVSGYRVTATPVAATVPAGVTATVRTVTVSGSPPATTATVGSLLNGVAYSITVTARNAVVATYSAPSTPTTVSVLALPAAPTVTSTVAGAGSASVTWSAPASDSPITQYTVRAVAPRPGTTPHTVTKTVLGSPPATAVDVTGLIVGLDYTVTVTATSAVGTGPASSPSGPVRPVVGISVTDRTAAEGNTGTTSFSFTVRLSAAQTVPVTVDVATADGSAGSTDFTALSTTVTFAPGQTTRTVTVKVVGDRAVEPDETFTVNVSNASVGIITDGVGIGTITNDD